MAREEIRRERGGAGRNMAGRNRPLVSVERARVEGYEPGLKGLIDCEHSKQY